LGELIIGTYEQKLCLCDWHYRKMRPTIDGRIQKFLNATYKENSSPLADTVMTQINEYLEQKRTIFELPILLCGTYFQQSVWNKLLQIPYGKTISYLDLAQNMNDPKAIRAIAAANGSNAISIIIPCHRVIGSNGDLVGYAGGLNAKQKLLSLENFQFQHSKSLQTSIQF
jgi:methylated-DNA-[protein]-cysteine S-methyltransferase